MPRPPRRISTRRISLRNERVSTRQICQNAGSRQMTDWEERGLQPASSRDDRVVARDVSSGACMSRIGLTLPVRSPEAKTRRGRRFEPGNTMAKGHPKGRLNKTTVFVQGLFNEHAPEVAQKVIALAKAGDPNAVRIVMDRVCPVRAGAPVRWDMPIIRHTDDIRTAYSKAIAD